MLHNWFTASAEGLLANIWLANPMTVMLMRPGFVPNIDTQKVYADISANEVPAGTGYVAGGNALTGKLAPYTAASDRTDFIANDPSWGPGATFDAAFAVIYDNSGTKPLWSCIDFQGTKSVSAGTFTLDFPSTGMLYMVPG